MGPWHAAGPPGLHATLTGSAPRWSAMRAHPAYGTAPLRQDLHGFTFLLGGVGESLSGPGAAASGEDHHALRASGHPVDDE